MSCDLRLRVFVPKNQSPPAGEFLGFEKITPEGAFVIFCVDGIERKFYPQGWLSVIDKNGVEVLKNAQGALPSGEGTSFGFNPFFGFDSPLPFWLWLLVVLGVGYVVLKDK